MNASFLSGVLFASLIPALVLVQKPALSTTLTECENLQAHEPLLIYEVAGATLTGSVDRTLVVYGDGVIKLATAEPGRLGTCTSLEIDPLVAAKLYQGLANAGASSMCDDEQLAIDLPLHTLTLLRGAHDMRGRTFSFWNADAGYGVVEAMLENFIAEQFGS